MNATSEPPRALSGLPSPLTSTADETAIATATAAAAAAQDVDLAAAAAQLRGSLPDHSYQPEQRTDSLQSVSGSEAAPGRVTKPRARKSPGSGAKRSEPSKRKFICSFSHYGCDVALSSKNEWKRHVSIQHLQLGFYRCDVGSCNPDNNPNTPSHKKVYNDFNRKDLFTQHHRRMHKPEPVAGSNAISNDPNSQDWRAFEESLEEVRNRCWHEKRKPPQRSTCGFCGRVFEGEGSWNERMEHVGGHYARDLPDACKEEREDEDLTNWAIQEGVVKEAVNGRHVLVDQPPASSERSYLGRGNDITMSDAPPVTGTNGQVDGQYPIDMELSRRESLGSSAYPPLNGSGRPGSSSGQPFAHLSASGYAVSDGSYQADGSASTQWSQPHSNSNDSTDRLEDLINRLINPKKPRMSKRLQWRCDCGLDSSVDFAEENPEDQRAFQALGKISIICKNSQSPLLNTSKTDQYEVIPCDQLAGRVQAEGKIATDHGLQRVNEAVAEDGAVLNDAPAPAA